MSNNSSTKLSILLPETDELTRPGTVVVKRGNYARIINFTYNTASEITEALETALTNVMTLEAQTPQVSTSPASNNEESNTATEPTSPDTETDIVTTTLLVDLPDSEEFLRPGTAAIRRGDFGYILNFVYSTISEITEALEETLNRVMNFETNAPEISNSANNPTQLTPTIEEDHIPTAEDTDTASDELDEALEEEFSEQTAN